MTHDHQFEFLPSDGSLCLSYLQSCPPIVVILVPTFLEIPSMPRETVLPIGYEQTRIAA
jgi:hypothetical protein